MDDDIEYVAPVTIESPCVLVCVMDMTTDWCLGCGRTREEIGAWTQMSFEDRRTVMALLPERMAVLEA